MEKEKTCNEVTSIANKYKTDKYTDDSTITLTISFEKIIEMDRLIKIGEATEKAFKQIDCTLGFDTTSTSGKFFDHEFIDIESLLEWAESEGE